MITLEQLRAEIVKQAHPMCSDVEVNGAVLLALIDVAEAATRCSVWMNVIELASPDEEGLLSSVRTLTAALEAAQEKR